MSRFANLLFGGTFLFFVSATTPTFAQQGIFREVKVSKNETITLGIPLSAAVRSMSTIASENRIRLRAGTFVRAQSIVVQLTSGGEVEAVFFTYDSRTDYTAMVNSYRKLLGDPASQGNRGDTEVVTTWRDADTEFEVAIRQSSLSTSLYDRRLSKR